MALGSTQHLTEKSTRNISLVGKDGRCVRLTTLPPSWLIVLKSGSLNLLEPSGPVQVCNGIALPCYCPQYLSDQCNSINFVAFFCFLYAQNISAIIRRHYKNITGKTDGIKPLAPELFFSFRHILYIKCE